MVDVIEKTLDVQGKEQGDKALVFGLQDIVLEGKGSIKAGGVGSAPELVLWHETIFPCIKQETLGDDLLNGFAHVFDERCLQI